MAGERKRRRWRTSAITVVGLSLLYVLSYAPVYPVLVWS